MTRVTATAALLLGLVAWTAGSAEAGPRPQWLSVGVVSGAALPDGNLSNYRWTTTARPEWGVEALAGTGRLGAGLRLDRWQTRQGTGIPGSGPGPEVALTTFEVRGRARVASVAGFDLVGQAGAGRLFIDYQPGRMTFDLDEGAPVEVRFENLREWTWSAGAGVEREFASRFRAGLEAERSRFALDTAHRAGDDIVSSRERFSTWTLRLRLAWVWRSTTS